MYVLCAIAGWTLEAAFARTALPCQWAESFLRYPRQIGRTTVEVILNIVGIT